MSAASALRTLIESRPPDLREVCEQLLRVRFLNATAVRGLALFDDPAIGRSLARELPSRSTPRNGPRSSTRLVSRPAFARALLDRGGRRNDPRPRTSRRSRPGRSAAWATPGSRSSWPRSGATCATRPPEKRRAMARLKARLTPDVLCRGRPGPGADAFNKTCASCHTLYGQGGEVGPDLTGSGRDNLDYLLENIVDPSATVNADFRMVVVAMDDGRVLNGIVRAGPAAP